MTKTDQIAKAICDEWLWSGAWDDHAMRIDIELFRRLARAVQNATDEVTISLLPTGLLLTKDMEPLGADFEAAISSNIESLYEE